ncbi:MAG: hypothetical protein H6R01_620 [Burkholderiaceae bacterium]|nr:hypothetical protein [Burkholderiaceae bacterium]
MRNKLGRFPILVYAIAAAATLLILPAATATEPIEIEGTAQISNAGIEQARQEAIGKAVKRATGLGGVALESSERLSPSGERLESSRLRAAGASPEYEIVDERVEGQRVHVRLRFEKLPTQGKRAAIPSYKKKLVVTSFAAQTPAQTDTSYRDFSNELMFQLEKSNRVLARFSEYAVPAANSGETERAIRMAVRRIAARYDSQFVVSGEVLESQSPSKFLWIGKHGRGKRQFEVRIAVYDGLTGTKLMQHRIDRFVDGSAEVGSDKPFGSSDFYATEYGAKVRETINEATASVLKAIENIPFTARIVRTAGSRIYIDAGTTSLIAPGDNLVSYRAQSEWEAADVHSHYEPPIAESPFSSLTITQVYPLFSIGELRANQKNAKVQPGDLVRFDHKKSKEE